MTPPMHTLGHSKTSYFSAPMAYKAHFPFQKILFSQKIFPIGVGGGRHCLRGCHPHPPTPFPPRGRDRGRKKMPLA
jgi:hypothetical protein